MCLPIEMSEGTRVSRSRRSRSCKRSRLCSGISMFVSEVNATRDWSVSNSMPQVYAGGCLTRNRVAVIPKISNGSYGWIAILSKVRNRNNSAQ
jgi:hypothetical protein